MINLTPFETDLHNLESAEQNSYRYQNGVVLKSI